MCWKFRRHSLYFTNRHKPAHLAWVNLQSIKDRKFHSNLLKFSKGVVKSPRGYYCHRFKSIHITKFEIWAGSCDYTGTWWESRPIHHPRMRIQIQIPGFWSQEGNQNPYPGILVGFIWQLTCFTVNGGWNISLCSPSAIIILENDHRLLAETNQVVAINRKVSQLRYYVEEWKSVSHSY